MSDVTIILATADQRPQWLAQAIASVPPACELIVEHDPYREGFIPARLRGLKRVTTDYVAFLDDDDVLGPEWLPRSLAMAQTGVDVVSAAYWETDEDLRPIREVHPLPASLSRLLSGHCPVNDGSLIRRSILEGRTWHVERDTVAMFTLWLDLLAAGARFDVVPELCWYHRTHPGQLSRTIGEVDARWRAIAIAEHRAVAV